jgi:hypothetical protein
MYFTLDSVPSNSTASERISLLNPNSHSVMMVVQFPRKLNPTQRPLGYLSSHQFTLSCWLVAQNSVLLSPIMARCVGNGDKKQITSIVS